MVHDMEERLFHRFQENETLALVAMVDPRMKCFAFADPSSAEKAVNLLKREARKIIFCSDDSQSPSTELVIEEDGIYTTLAKRAAEYKLMSSAIDKVDAEVSLYLKEATLNHKEDPLKSCFAIKCLNLNILSNSILLS